MRKGIGSRQAALVALALLFLLALWLRLYRVEGQSLWNDEGTSVALAGRDLATITRDASHDIHPPFYYYLLHIWVWALGNSVFAVRSLSALLGVLVVLMTFLLGERLFDRRAALIAAFLVFLSPLQVYYSQEVRMYILVTLLSALSFYLFLRWLDRLFPGMIGLAGGESSSPPEVEADSGVVVSRLQPGTANPRFAAASRESNSLPESGKNSADAAVSQLQPGIFNPRSLVGLALPIAYVLIGILAMYSHYFAFTVIVAQNLLFVWRWLLYWRGSRQPFSARSLQPLLAWAAAQAAILLAFAPWLRIVWPQLRYWPAVSEPFGLATLTRRVLQAFSVGQTLPQPAWLPTAFALILLLGWIARLAQQRRASAEEWWRMGAAWLYLLTPPLVMYLLSRQRPMYNAKFLLLAAPAFALLLGRALDLPRPAQGWRRWLAGGWTVAGLLFIAVVSLLSLRGYFYDARYARDDYRAIAQYIEAAAGPNDAILINAPGQYETFGYYYHGPLPIYPLPRQRPLDPAATERDLQEMVAGRGRVYAIFWATAESDPQRLIEGWLDRNTFKATEAWYGNLRFVLYAAPQSAAPSARQPLDAAFGELISLKGYALRADATTAGDILQLTLYWQARAPIARRYKVFVHVLDALDHIVGQRDAEPGGGVAFTSGWTVGEEVIDAHGVLILPATPPGRYRLAIGLYDPDTGKRLLVSGGEDRLFLTPVTVRRPDQPPPRALLGMQQETEIAARELRLLGLNLTRAGQSQYIGDPSSGPLHPGEVLHLTLFWQATAAPQNEAEMTLKLLNREGREVWRYRSALTGGQYPLREWEAGEIVRDQHYIFLPADLAPGDYRLLLGLEGLPSGQEYLAPRFLHALALR